MRFRTKHFSTYPWHSVNIIPHAALVMTYNDDEVPVRHGTLLEVCLFGQVFHIDLPIQLKRSWSTTALGPLYSRRRKIWYRATK